jgi:hypothetical protein
MTQLACHSPRIHAIIPIDGIGTNTPGCVKKTIKRRVHPSYIVCKPESLYSLVQSHAEEEIRIDHQKHDVDDVHRPPESRTFLTR